MKGFRVTCENKGLEKELQSIFDEINSGHDLLQEKYKGESGLDGHNGEYVRITKEGFKKIDALKIQYGEDLQGAIITTE